MLYFISIYRTLLFIFLLIFVSPIDAMEQMDDESRDNYMIEWLKVEPSHSGFDFHKENAHRLAKNKFHSGLDDQSNMAIIGLSLHTPSTHIYVTFPNIVYSTYKTLEDSPTPDVDGITFMSISDMMRSDMAEGKTRVHRILDFLSHLFSFEYTSKWDLYNVIDKCLEIIKNNDSSELSRIPSSRSRERYSRAESSSTVSHENIDVTLNKVLHSEQVFLYRAITGDGIFNFMIDTLLKKDHVLDMLKQPEAFITFDILTYNDMCTKCFSTCYHMADILAANINKIIMKKLKEKEIFSDIFNSRKGQAFHVGILVSSFRPYVTSRKAKKDGYLFYKDADFVNPMRPRPKNNKVDQFFNPWIAQHIFCCEFSDLIESINCLKPYETLTIENVLDLATKIQQNKQGIESSIINEISDLFIKNSHLFLARSDLSFFMLPIAYELARIDKNSQIPSLLTFIRKVLNTDEGQDVIGIFNIKENRNIVIDAAIFFQNSVPYTSGYYDFEKMLKAIKSIEFNGVNPILKNAIISKIQVVFNIIKQKHPKKELIAEFTRLGCK